MLSHCGAIVAVDRAASLGGGSPSPMQDIQTKVCNEIHCPDRIFSSTYLHLQTHPFLHAVLGLMMDCVERDIKGIAGESLLLQEMWAVGRHYRAVHSSHFAFSLELLLHDVLQKEIDMPSSHASSSPVPRRGYRDRSFVSGGLCAFCEVGTDKRLQWKPNPLAASTTGQPKRRRQPASYRMHHWAG